MQTYILLDQSGSMIGNWTETIGAINEYVAGLAADPATEKSRVHLASFDASGTMNYTTLRSGQEANKWNAVGVSEASPRGMTPLYDAIARMSADIENDAPDLATFVILTDGVENASREATKESVKLILDRFREKGYDVVFIGADFDNFNQARGLGNAVGSTIMMDAGNYGATMAMMSMRSSGYAKTGETTEFSDEQRATALGV